MSGWQVFPCFWQGERRKRPLTRHGFKDASGDPAEIIAWWDRSPQALIGTPTGCYNGCVVLDVDVKDRRYGFDTLDALGFAILPETPMAHTASGGLHLYFAPPAAVEIACTEGERGKGIGPGLDWRGAGGYVIMPSPGSGYSWDPHWNFETVGLAPAPAALLPREPQRLTAAARPVRPTTGLSPYAEAALDSACRRIIAAAAGHGNYPQRRMLRDWHPRRRRCHSRGFRASCALVGGASDPRLRRGAPCGAGQACYQRGISVRPQMMPLTAIAYRGKPAADGPRHRALGHSMAVPVMRWIGERVQLIQGHV